jgi:hypothetical protein
MERNARAGALKLKGRKARGSYFAEVTTGDGRWRYDAGSAILSSLRDLDPVSSFPKLSFIRGSAIKSPVVPPGTKAPRTCGDAWQAMPSNLGGKQRPLGTWFSKPALKTPGYCRGRERRQVDRALRRAMFLLAAPPHYFGIEHQSWGVAQASMSTAPLALNLAQLVAVVYLVESPAPLIVPQEKAGPGPENKKLDTVTRLWYSTRLRDLTFQRILSRD